LKKTPFIVLSAAIILVSIAWISFTPILFPSAEDAAKISAPHPGFPAPAFSLETLSGDSISLADFKGQPVLIFFWASWCSVCKRTMPGLQTVYDEFHEQGFEILAVNSTLQDTISSAVSYYEGQQYTFPFLIDPDGIVTRNYQTHALPTSILVNPDGIVVDVVIGSGLSEAYLSSQIIKLLSNSE
jgi:peroxiredoxin